jgi:Ca2+-binding RTX toxin-like protein
MRNRTQNAHSSASRWIRRAATAAAVAAIATATAGIAAAHPGGAHAGGASYGAKEARFKEPTLRDGELTIKGTRADDKIALRLQAGMSGAVQVDVGNDGTADFTFDRAAVTSILVRARAGDDLVRIDDSAGAFTNTIPTTIRGGAGSDTLAGGAGAETFRGGPGSDSIDGNGGADVAFMGAGDDLFVWDPGDGSDVVEGEAGRDTMLFNGAPGLDQVDVSANGSRLRFFRTQGTITMDTSGVERVDFTALGSADEVTVNDLTGTDVDEVNIDLASTPGGTSGDGQRDRIVVNATNRNDAIDVRGDAGGVTVDGLAARVRILHSEAANDRLELNTLEGTDTVDSGGLAAGVIQLVVDGALVP